MTGGRRTSHTPRGGRPGGRDRERDQGRTRSILIAAAVSLAFVTGCGGSGSKPTTLDTASTISLSGETLVSVPGGLCHVKGTITNLSRIPVDVTIQWQALNLDDGQLGTTSLTIDNLLPGETRPFETTGFVSSDSVIACSQIRRFPIKDATVTQA